MTQDNNFSLKFMGKERHLLLPTVTSIIVTQNLYDILFQYVISPEKEEKLKVFINKLEKHIKSKTRTPFSMPLSYLEFLEDGLQELKLLNWMEADILVFQVETNESQEDTGSCLEEVLNLLQNIFTFKQVDDTSIIHVYPSNLTRF